MVLAFFAWPTVMLLSPLLANISDLVDWLPAAADFDDPAPIYPIGRFFFNSSMLVIGDA